MLAVSEMSTDVPLERVFCDVVEPVRNAPIGESNYFDTVHDEYSGYALVRVINHQSTAGTRVIKNFR